MKQSHVRYLGKHIIWVLSGKYVSVCKVNTQSHNLITTVVNPFIDVCFLTMLLVKTKRNVQVL